MLQRGGEWKQEAILKGSGDVVSIVAFSPNGKYLASASGDVVNIWDLEGKKEQGAVQILASMPVVKTDTVIAVVWSPTENALFFHLDSGFFKKWYHIISYIPSISFIHYMHAM